MLKVPRKLVVGNWKMNGGVVRNELLLAGILRGRELWDVDVVVCPPFPYISQVKALIGSAGIDVGAQNLALHKEGAFTGEVSAAMLMDVGCRWTIVGHSERRTLFGETDELIARKVEVALNAGLTPILCVGETLVEREMGGAFGVVSRQIDAVLDLIGVGRVAALVVAYEPVWAIGTGKTATPEQVQSMHSFVRSHLANRGGRAELVRILYGGSVSATNAPQLFAERDVDGALVGGASLSVDSFSTICAAAS